MENSDPKRGATPVSASTAATPTSGKPSSGRPVSGKPEAGARAVGSRPWLLRKRGSVEVLKCPDLATLRSWMMERRVSRDDEISRGGKVYRRLGNIVEFESLFHSAEVERAERRRGQKAGTSGIMPVPQLPATAPAKAEGSKRSEMSVPPQLRVTPPGLTPATGAMNPLRLTPSGQPPRQRPPVPAVPILQLPETAPAPAAAVQPVPPAASGAAASARYAPSSPSGPTPNKPAPPVAAKPAAAVASASKAPPAAPVASRPAPPNRPSGAFAVEKPKPEAAAAVARQPEPEASKDDSTVTDPTRRFVRLEAAPVRPVESLPVNLAADAPADASKSSGSDTVAFKRATADELAEPADADATLLNPPPVTRAPARPVKSLDPVEEALRNSDPVPRHLKDPTDPNRTSRIPSLDTTERIEGDSSHRGLILLVISVALAGLLIWGLRSAGTPETGGGSPPKTGPGTETPTVGEKPSPTPATGSDSPAVSAGPTTPPPHSDSPGPASDGKPAPRVDDSAVPTSADKPAPQPGKTATGANPTVAAPTALPVPSKPEPAAPAKPASETKPATATPAPAAAAGTGTGTSATPPAAKPTSAPAAASPAKPAPTPTGGKKIVVTEFPKTFDEQMDLAQRLVEHEQFDEAQRLFETILSYASHVPAVHVGLGKCALETGRTDTAIQHYNNALGKAPNYGPAIFGLAKTYRARGDKERALQHYRRYLELYPNSAAAAVARDSIARIEGTAPPAAKPSPPPAAPGSQSELVKPPTQGSAPGSELVKPQ